MRFVVYDFASLAARGLSLSRPLIISHVAGPSRHSLDSTMEPENRKAEFEDAKAKAAEFLAKGDPQAAIDQCVQSPYLHRAPPTEIPRPADGAQIR